LASLDDFLSLQIRVGTIVSAQLQKGPKPALALRIDFGELGSRHASAPITDPYHAEVAVLAADNGRGERTLVIPERPVPDGARAD
jgi:tRNA-binding EMAP/Myf-like protein